MGFFDKVKNMFTEEVEDDEVKVQKIKQDVKHVSIESPDKEETSIADEYNFKQEMKFTKPVFFDEDDFEDLNLTEKKIEKSKPKSSPVEEKKEIQKPIYSGNSTIDLKEKKVFKPTPIISPVYGILDKNYHKEDIINRTETVFEPSNDKIDKVREKAYGTLEDELENTLFGNSILFKKDEEGESDDDIEIENVDEDSISNLTDDVGKELDKLLEKKQKREKFKKDKPKEKIEEDEDLLGFIDSTLYKDGDDN